MKKCTKCGESKPITAFSKNSAAKDGLYTRCKACDNASKAQWRVANPDKEKARMAKWQAANPDKVKQHIAKWRRANPSKQVVYVAKWKAAHPESNRIYDQNRRARKCGNDSKLSLGLIERLSKLQRGKCACCRGPLISGFHRDHIMPLALGGSNTDDNIQLLCPACNMQKSAKHPVDFMQQRGFLL